MNERRETLVCTDKSRECKRTITVYHSNLTAIAHQITRLTFTPSKRFEFIIHMSYINQLENMNLNIKDFYFITRGPEPIKLTLVPFELQAP